MNPFMYYAEAHGMDIASFSKAAGFLNVGGTWSVTEWDWSALGTPPSAEDLAKVAALPEPAPTSAQLVAYAEAKQASLVSGGFSFNIAAPGQPENVILADTDLSGRTNLNGLVDLAKLDDGFTSVWVQGGKGVTVTAPEIIALGVAVGKFVVATYQTLAAVFAGISGGSITTIAQIDAASWPSNTGASA